MVGGRKMQAAVAASFACLLKTIHQQGKSEMGGLETSNNVGQLGGLRDRSCWATLEVSRPLRMLFQKIMTRALTF